MALLAFEKAPFSAIFSLSIQMSSNQVLVDRGFVNGREIHRRNGQNTDANAGRSAP